MKWKNIMMMVMMAAGCWFSLPVHSQRISVGKKGLVKVMRTDSTCAQEFVRDEHQSVAIRKTAKAAGAAEGVNTLASYLKSDVDLNIPVSKVKQEKTFAVIIANENYQEEVNVEFALNDGMAFREYCIKLLGIPESNLHIRKDATLNNMLAEINWMQNIAKAYGAEARFIFYYAGHGMPDESNGTSYLLPVDGKSNILATGYSMSRLYAELNGLNAACVTVLMDACFSGSKRGEGMLASARGVALKAKAEAPKGNMLVMTAAQGSETAYPYKEKKHGLFTYFLLKKLQESKGKVTYGDLFNYVKTNVAQKSVVVNEKSQTPTIAVSGDLVSTWQGIRLNEDRCLKYEKSPSTGLLLSMGIYFLFSEDAVVIFSQKIHQSSFL